MNLDWLAHPIAPYIFLMLGIGLCLYLFFTLNTQMEAIQRQQREKQDLFAAAILNLQQGVDDLQNALRQRETDSLSQMPREGINLNKRTQALRMHRRGEAVPTIAAALAIPEEEVKLLLKVQELVLKQA
jgi:hypothetical protein